MAIVKQKDRKTGIVYVYEQKSTWIPEIKQPRSQRKLIGKIDLETGEMIPTGSVGRPRTKAAGTSTPETDNLRTQLDQVREKNAELTERIRQLEETERLKELEIKRLKSEVSKAVLILLCP